MFHDVSLNKLENGLVKNGENGHHGSSYVLKQVEVNTIAAGGAGLAQKVTQMHRRSMLQWEYVDPVENMARIPDNRSLDLVANGLAAAWVAYGIFHVSIKVLYYAVETL